MAYEIFARVMLDGLLQIAVTHIAHQIQGQEHGDA
jgi:hypothetical protein